MKFEPAKDLKRLGLVVLASFIMAFNIKSFVHTGNLFPGGANGLTLLIQRLADLYLHKEIPYSLVNILLNAGPVYIGFRFIGKKFTMFSCLMIVLTGFLIDIIPGVTITQDILLISIFGGIINGFCISLCLSVDATTGGTDFIGIFLSERKGMDSFPIVLGINTVILIVAGYFFGWDRALYSVIFQYASTTVIHMLYRRYQQSTVLIVTKVPDRISQEIYQRHHHGATIIEGEGSYSHEDRKILYTVVSKAETGSVIKIAQQIDPEAFINIVDTRQIAGRFYFRPED